MTGVGTFLSMVGIVGSAVLAPMIYLSFRGGGDPEGIIDGLIRLTWLMPLVWVVGTTLEARGRPGWFKGVMQLHLPLVITLAAVGMFFLGWSNDGRVIVSKPGATTRSQEVRRARGERVYVEASFLIFGPVGLWAHSALPAHPLPLPRAGER
jgi:hypothetical protein